MPNVDSGLAFKAQMTELLPVASISAIAPPHLTPERVLKILFAAGAKTPALYNCDGVSVARAVLQATELGLEAGGALGEAYLIPYGRNCTLVIGYQGYLRLIHNSGECTSLNVQNVYERDRFELDLATSHVLHVPYLLGDRGQLLFAYARTKNVHGEYAMTVMTRLEIEAIRKKSQAQNVWNDHFGEMARKTVLRRHAKYQIKSVKVHEAMSVDKELVDEAQELRGQVTRAQAFLDSLDSLRAPDEVPALEAAGTPATYPLPESLELSEE